MTETSVSRNVSFRSRPIVKLVAFVFSWFLFALSFVLLLFAVLAVGAVGGTCASGNTAYVIAVQCPAAAIDFLPWCIFTGLIAVAIGVVFAGGIGISTRVFAWPILFCGLGAFFLLAGIFGGEVVGWLLGIMFIVMGLVPLVIELRASVQRVFLGSFNLRGIQFYEGPKAQPSFSSRTMPNPPGAIRASAADWAFSILGFLVSSFAGVVCAYLLTVAVSGSAG
jgi:hypothetical protein